MSKMTVNFILNGKAVAVETESNKRLLDTLREDCGMLSVKEGCSEGECGACTVIYNGDPVTSCCMLAGQAEGSTIVTLEGLADGDKLDAVQIAFMEIGAVQCGFCTPGMLLTARALLDKNPNPTMDEIKLAMSGNLCRCTGYAKIMQGVELAAKMQRELKEGGAANG